MGQNNMEDSNYDAANVLEKEDLEYIRYTLSM
jgi:hypothetical protein